ncbi:MAG TPA: ABC transporter permease [Sediminispirochaeta sp.]|nr:ABC transporter permease [Sediminispirochaeta sp.]
MKIRPSPLTIVSPIYPFVVILLLWEVLHILLGARLIPAPLTVLLVLGKMAAGGELWLHLGVSSLRIGVGLLSALLFSVPLGITIGVSTRADRFLSPLLYTLYPLPKIAFLPIFMVLFGLGNSSKIILIWTVIVFQITIAARDGIKEISPAQIKALRVLGLSKLQFFSHLYLPSSLPRIFSALRLSLGISISVLFFAENYATTYGIGHLVMNSWIMVDYPRMFAGILSVSLLGLLLFRLIDRLEARLCPWVRL